MKKYLPALGLLLFLTGCVPIPRQSETILQFFSMDTPMTITAYGPQAEDAVSAAQAEIFRLAALLSRTQPKSDVSRLNAAAGDPDPVALSHETVLLLEAAQHGYPEFDITIAPVMDAWGFGRGEDGIAPDQEGRAPEDGALQALLGLVDGSRLEIDTTADTARLPLPGMKVDLGGVGKGYAGDRATAVLKENGVTSAILDLGGNITAMGTRTDGKSWRVGVTDPKSPGDFFCVVALTDQTAATSGGYQRYFVQNDVSYHHIIDPATGYPADSGLISATVVSVSGATADLLSTYCFIAGPEKAMALWRGRDDVELILVQTDGTVLITAGLESGLQFQGEEGGYTYEIVSR